MKDKHKNGNSKHGKMFSIVPDQIRLRSETVTDFKRTVCSVGDEAFQVLVVVLVVGRYRLSSTLINERC